MPIMTSGTGPAVLLALGAVGWLPPELAQLLAEAVVVLRLAGMGIVVRRISGLLLTPGGALVRIRARWDRHPHRGSEGHPHSLTWFLVEPHPPPGLHHCCLHCCVLVLQPKLEGGETIFVFWDLYRGTIYPQPISQPAKNEV